MKTNTTVHLYIDEALSHLDFHCGHDDGSHSYRLTPRFGANVAVYLGASDPAQLRKLAGALQTLADEWEAGQS